MALPVPRDKTVLAPSQAKKLQSDGDEHRGHAPLTVCPQCKAPHLMVLQIGCRPTLKSADTASNPLIPVSRILQPSYISRKPSSTSCRLRSNDVTMCDFSNRHQTFKEAQKLDKKTKINSPSYCLHLGVHQKMDPLESSQGDFAPCLLFFIFAFCRYLQGQKSYIIHISS